MKPIIARVNSLRENSTARGGGEGSWRVGCVKLVLVALVLLSAMLMAAPAVAQIAAEGRNVVLVAHHDLNGNGDGGEGLAIQQRSDGRRLLFIAHEAPKNCLSVVDVTRSESPVLINTIPSPHPGITRCDSLSLSGNLLAVANQTTDVGQKSAGMWVLDVSDFDRVRQAKSLQDLALSFFDASGPHSRGAHCLWFVDGEFAHLTTGMSDFTPSNPLDDQFDVIVDLRDPRHPREVGRWWYPGTSQSDRCLPGCLPQRHKLDDGYRPHNIEVWPDHPDRAYLGYIDAKMAWINGDPANNLMGHAPGSTLFDSYQNPTIQDLASENGEDVEIFVNGGSLGYHALTLTGVSCTGANYTNCSISYQNPNFPTINVGNVGVSNVGGSLQLNAGFGDLGNIVDAFSESPVPEPNSLILLGTAIAGLAWRMRRKTS